jgi:hypothetical protein
VVIDFPPVPPGEPIAVSATLYMTYSRCPDQALGRLRGIYPEESKAAFKGGLAHRVFARHLTNGSISNEDFDRVCKEEIGAGLNPKLGALGLRPSQLGAVIKEVGDLYEGFKALSARGFRVAELFVELEPAEGLKLRGSIDAVFDDPDGIRLVDWKTGGLYETEQQLGFYSMLWAMDTGELPARIEAVSIGSGERITAVPTIAAITATAEEVAALVDALRRAFASGQEQVERVAGPWCRFCPQLDGCSEGSAAVKVADAG